MKYSTNLFLGTSHKRVTTSKSIKCVLSLNLKFYQSNMITKKELPKKPKQNIRSKF